MPDICESWYAWEKNIGSDTATVSYSDLGVYRVEKPNDDGTTRNRVYPHVKPLDRVRLTVEARLLSDNADDDTTPEVGIDYPNTGDLVASARVSSRHWTRLEVEFTVPFDCPLEQTLPITIGIWTGKTGIAEFRNPMLYINGTQLGPNFGMEQLSATMGSYFPSLRLESFSTALLLGRWNDPKFRMFGQLYSMRSVNWSTTHRFQTVELYTSGNGSSRNVCWDSKQMGYNGGGSMAVVKLTFQGEQYLALWGNGSYLWTARPGFSGYLGNYDGRNVAAEDVSDIVYLDEDDQNANIGNGEMWLNGVPNYYGGNVIAPVSFNKLGIPSGGLFENGSAGDGFYRINADGSAEAHIVRFAFELTNKASGLTINLPIAFTAVSGLSATLNSDTDLWDEYADRFRFGANLRQRNGSTVQMVVAPNEGTTFTGAKGGVNISVYGVADV